MIIFSSILWLERSPGKENGNPLQYSCLENPVDRGLAGYSPWGRKELDITEWLGTYTHIAGGNFLMMWWSSSLRNESLVVLLIFELDCCSLLLTFTTVYGLPQWLSKESTSNTRDIGSIPGSGRSPGGRNSNPLPYSFAWEIPWTEEPGRGHKRVRHDLATKQQQ